MARRLFRRIYWGLKSAFTTFFFPAWYANQPHAQSEQTPSVPRSQSTADVAGLGYCRLTAMTMMNIVTATMKRPAKLLAQCLAFLEKTVARLFMAGTLKVARYPNSIAFPASRVRCGTSCLKPHHAWTWCRCSRARPDVQGEASPTSEPARPASNAE